MGGGKFIPDFVMAKGFSGGWNITFVELEAPNVPLFTNNGVMGRHLRTADRQINDWKRFVAQNQLQVLRDLSFAIRDGDLNYTIPGRGEEPRDSVGCKLYDPDCMIIWHYVIVIGRSSQMNPDDIFRKSHLNHDSYEIMTYDRFLDSAKNCNEQNNMYEN
ncbi:MAG: DUF4263 domain-containing protein [Limnospira sp. PMC 1240.20]|uniref:Shedu anti-phage system protein SduA domain-containing protein n=1 Tax=unclassified Limnospira TaxID=2642885 RepID=UPI0028E0BE3C|nr:MULTISPECIES: Shedu anti-phage system protein SduA domain-containing protein [unclassified Limnospira]MDT9298223.1 DUF4263 domain-containing protein [Arthrospira platensis PCC 7345]MDT9313747.1 DUF4263 domain-containing protein [Limnospira sp. Paracas R14]MDT9180870.1 DUF4263 domain-containing protein [Limnospira sp. PMC 1238.20]MDT9191062.1 DUF4263 domain-containing protein [Limnospira sp. PMC 894.15]MDT9196198.1 DUF4263 domain-containing protein [Limnospira sp. PMC 1245.20]